MPYRHIAKHQTIGSFLFDYLYQRGIRHAFGIPGDFALPTFKWLEQSKIKLIGVTHEPMAGFAADGYARTHGLGLACVTYCVGGLNMLNSIAGAYAEKSPVIVISGGPSRTERRADPLLHHKVKTFDTQRRIFEEVTCANTVLLSPETAAAEIVRVVETVAQQCRPGYIEVPYDIVDVPMPPFHPPKTEPAATDIESLAECLRDATAMINKAKRPLILAGIELNRHKLTDCALELAETFNIPVAASMLSKGVIRENHPLYIGVYGGALSAPACRRYVDNSDCVIMLGAFITDMFLGVNTSKLARQKSILATTERTSVGLHCYDGILFKDFLRGLCKAKIRKRAGFKNPNPGTAPKPLEPKERHDKLTIEEVFRILGCHLDENSVVVCDAGDALFGAIGVRTAKREEFVADAYYLSMGFAIPAGIGVMAAHPKKRVFAVVGDGAFQMTGLELSTAAQYGMAPIVLVLNNDGYGTQRFILDGTFNEIRRWDYAEVCDVIRAGQATVVQTKGQLDGALANALSSDELSIIEIKLPRNSCSPALRRLGAALSELRNPRGKQPSPSRDSASRRKQNSKTKPHKRTR